MNKTNTNITFKGEKLAVSGTVLREGSSMPEFVLTAQDLSDLKSSAFAGKVLVIATVPSLDTPVCAVETKRFNTAAEELSSDVIILTVSMDLPFAQARWCGAEGCSRVITASEYKQRGFAKAFGVHIDALSLLSRAVFVVDKKGMIVHVEYVKEITEEPDYSAALAKVSMLTEAQG